jgi:hypothetical protein
MEAITIIMCASCGCLPGFSVVALAFIQSTQLTLTHASSPPLLSLLPPSTHTNRTQSFFFPYPNIIQAWRAAATLGVDAAALAEDVETEEATVVVAVAADAGVVGTKTRRRAGPP